MPRSRSLRCSLLAVIACLVGCSGQSAASPTVTPPSPPPAAPIAAPPAPTTNATMPDPTPTAGKPANALEGKQVATFANGCFWCTEAVLEQLDGVLDVTSGYMGGTVDEPTYQQVCTGETGHAECAQVTFDPKVVTYEALLDWFFRSHDPTSLNRQGADEGTQYRSAIFFHSDAQRDAARAAIQKAQPKYSVPIVTEVTKATRFWPAEEYHQDYFRKHPNQGYCRAVIAPKLHKLGLTESK